MAITLTKKVTTTYANGWPEPGSEGSISAIVQPYIEEMVVLGKTDGVNERIDDNTMARLWVDEASAQEFVALATGALAEIGRTDATITITDI
jgi:hypothetical protein